MMADKQSNEVDISATRNEDPSSLESLIQHVFVGSKNRLQFSTCTTAEDNQALLEKRGTERSLCDFKIIAAGVEFDVHRCILSIGPQHEQLQRALHPGPEEVDILTIYCQPMLVDRLVKYIYTKSYQLDKDGRATQFHCVSTMPENVTEEQFALRDLQSYEFHLKMYSIAEILNYPQLLRDVRGKLAEKLVYKLHHSPETLKDIVDSIYGHKHCKDAEGKIKDVVVAAVIAHEYKAWGHEMIVKFVAMVKGHTQFMVDWENASEKYKKELEPQRR